MLILTEPNTQHQEMLAHWSTAPLHICTQKKFEEIQPIQQNKKSVSIWSQGMFWPQSAKVLPNTDSGLSNYTFFWVINAVATAENQVLLMSHYIIVTPMH